MSSRELVDELLGIAISITDDGSVVLEAAEFLPEDSALNTALRGGDWTQRQYAMGRIINELALARADGHDYSPELVYSPAELAVQKAHDEWQKRRHDENLAQLRGERR